MDSPWHASRRAPFAPSNDTQQVWQHDSALVDSDPIVAIMAYIYDTAPDPKSED